MGHFAIPPTLKSHLLLAQDAHIVKESESCAEDAVSVRLSPKLLCATMIHNISSFQKALGALSAYSIDPQRISFGLSPELSTSQGGFGDVKRGSLSMVVGSTGLKVSEDTGMPVAVKILRTADNVEPSTLQRVSHPHHS